MKLIINPERRLFRRDKMIYGHFIEHFHRQIYGGVYDPESPFADEAGLRTDVLEAMREIEVPILRWPGGCFVSSYHWKDAVGPERKPLFDKAWRVEEPNEFGTDEYIAMCRKVGCEPYICTNAGTGTAEEMSDWAEYCNLESEGQYAKWRIANGHPEPYHVKYWSIGNENYGSWEIGAKETQEWGRLVLEAAKMLLRVDPEIELSAAALADVDWNLSVLKHCGERLKWISVHSYWDAIHMTNDYADYEETMAYTEDLEKDIRKVRGLLCALGMEKQVKIAYDEWNLRGWYHPNAHTVIPGKTKESYLYPRDRNDDNTKYTMADTVFTACFLNTCNRNGDIVGMANFAPIVNTRGCIYTHRDGIVLRGTYHVFRMYVKLLGDTVLDQWSPEKESMTVRSKTGEMCEVDAIDAVATLRQDGVIAVAAVNKDASARRQITLEIPGTVSYRVHTLNGDSTEAYNDVGVDGIRQKTGDWTDCDGSAEIMLEPHSVNVIEIKTK